MKQLSRVVLSLLSFSFLASACSSDGTVDIEEAIALLASPTSLTLAQGATTGNTATITLTRSGGFSGPVTLSLTSSPAGISGTFSPTVVASGVTTSTLTINVPGGQAAGPHTLTIRGTGSGVDDATGTISVTVTAVSTPAISLAAAPTTLPLVAGATTGNTVAITLNRLGGFTGAVNLAVASSPTGPTGTFSPASLATGVSASTLTVNVPSGQAAGTYTLTITGSGTGVSNAVATVSVTVTAAPVPAIALAALPTTLPLAQGATTGNTVAITLTRSGGFTGAVNLAVSSSPTGPTGTFNPASLATGVTASTLTVNVPSGQAPGSYTLTITGTGTGVTNATATVTLTVTAAAGIALVASQPTLSLAQGATTGNTVTITLTRSGGFTGAVNLALSSSPTGVTGTFNPASLATGVTSTTLTINVPAGQQTGLHALTITGTGTGVANAVATVALTVTQAQGGNSVVFSFCATPLPIWVAFQDGSGAWAAVTGVNNSYTFSLASGRGGVVWVTPAAGGGFNTTFQYGLTADLQGIGTGQCPVTPPVGKTLTGTFAGGGAFDQFQASIGFAFTFGNGPGPFTLNNVPSGSRDLISTLSTLDVMTFTSTLSKMIIRRGVDYPANSAIPVLDFLATASANASANQSSMVQEWFLPVQRTLTINGSAGATTSSSIGYITGASGAFFGTLSFLETQTSTATTRSIPTVPLANQATGDLHQISVTAANAGSTLIRNITTFLKNPGTNTVLTLPTATATPVVTPNVTTPYMMPRVQYTTQADVDDILVLSFSQGTGAGARSVQVNFTAGYLGTAQGASVLAGMRNGAVAFDWSHPNFQGLSGFLALWMLFFAQTDWGVDAIGHTALFQYVEGVITSYINFRGTI